MEPEMESEIEAAANILAKLPAEPKEKSLRDKLMERSEEIKKLVDATLSILVEPTTIAQMSRDLRVNRQALSKAVITSIDREGNPHNVGWKRIGTYDVIYKKVEVKP